MTTWSNHNWTGLIRYSLLGIIFSVACGQNVIYTNTQNTYFVHGLAQAGYGMLSQSFLAQTADPFPLFSLLVNITYRITPVLFYVYFVLLGSVYVYALMEIMVHVAGIVRFSLLYYTCFAGLITLYSGGISSPFHWLQWGVAGQYVMGTELLPNVFGVFLVLSIERFLADRPRGAVLALGVACAFHSTYLLGAAMLVLAYISITLAFHHDFRRAILIGMGALVLVSPVLVDDLIRFGPTTSDIQQAAQHILVDFRLPHHARPDNWMGNEVLQQLVVVVLSVIIVRRTRLFWILVIAMGLGFGLTLLQVVLDSDWLALLFPWRISAVLVPVATVVIIAWFGQAFDLHYGKLLAHHATLIRLLDVVLIAAMCLVGLISTFSSVQAQITDPARPMMDFVHEHLTSGDIYLIPLDLKDFQLTTGAPVLVDWKSHPYRDAEVLEWYERVEVAQRFYNEIGNMCDTLRNIHEAYHITGVVLPIKQEVECPFVQPFYLDEQYRVLHLDLTS